MSFTRIFFVSMSCKSIDWFAKLRPLVVVGAILSDKRIKNIVETINTNNRYFVMGFTN
jgi:hypothetical protein